MSRKIFSTLSKAKDKLRQTIKQKMAEQEKLPQGKTLQSMWNKQSEKVSEGMKKAKSGLEGLSLKLNLRGPSDLLREAKQINLRDKISKFSQAANQKGKQIEEEESRNPSIKKLKRSASELMERVKSLGKENPSGQSSPQYQNSASKKQRAIQRVQDKSKDNKQQSQFFMDFLKAKAREIDERLKKISAEMKENSFTKKTSFLQLLKGFILNFYWRVILLVSFVAFAYGFGSSLPKEIRIAMKGKDEKQPQTI